MGVEHITSGEVQAQNQGARQLPRKRRVIIFVGICVFNTALLVLLATLLLTPASKQSGAHTGSVTNPGDAASPLIGLAAPDFTLPVLSGSPEAARLHLAALKGKPIILNFWASWCAPCNDEAALLQSSWPALKARGIVLIGIDGSEKASDALKFVQKYTISYPNVQDAVNSATAMDYGVTGLPETIFINPKGIIVAKWISPLTAQGLKFEEAKLVQ